MIKTTIISIMIIKIIMAIIILTILIKIVKIVIIIMVMTIIIIVIKITITVIMKKAIVLKLLKIVVTILKRTCVQILTVSSNKYKKTSYRPTLLHQVQCSKGTKNRDRHTLSSILRPKGTIVFRALL